MPVSLGGWDALQKTKSFPGRAVAKNLPTNAGAPGDVGSIPGSGRSLGVGNGNPLQYSCLENSMDRGRLTGYSPWGCKRGDLQGVEGGLV